MDIGEWVKKNRWEVEAHDSPTGAEITEYESKEGRFICVNGLGEFAWKELVDCEEIENYFDQLDSNDNCKINLESINQFADHGEYICLYWEVAIGCLGLKEVIRRLKEFNKDEKF